ncbi:MAG: helix-turn-helix transcriptional regulator [Acidobacteriota bacterium]
MNLNERINRILFIMTYVSQNQGVRLEDLARQVGMRPRQLVKELDFMLLIGKPPFRPDDYIDIYVEEDRVYIEFDQMLNRPLRFTRPEAMALLISLQLLDAEVHPEAVQSLKTKIERAIASMVDPNHVEDRVIFERPSKPVSKHFSLLRQSIEDRTKVEIDYYSMMRNKTSSRTIRPYFLMKNLGYWYLTGHCEMRKDLRTFKFERILAVKPIPETFSVPEDLNIEKYKEDFLRSMGGHQIRIYFDASVAPWVREQWGDAVKSAEDDGVVLSLSSETLEYPSRLILSYAPHARPLSPPELIDKIRQDAQEIHEKYGAGAVN